MDNQKKKLSKVLSTKLSIDDYNAFQMLTKLEYQAGLIKEQSTSELLRFTIRHILNQLQSNLIYPMLEEEQQQEQKKAQINQHIHSQVILPPTTISAASPQQRQIPNNVSRRNILGGQKMTPWKLSSLLSMQTNYHRSWW